MSTETKSNRSAEISAALQQAYANASKLKVTKLEAKALRKPFPESIIEILSANGAIYIPHIFISQRLSDVFGPGAHTLLIPDHYHDDQLNLIRAEFVLVIRGCVVGEFFGETPFGVNKTDKYADALASLQAKALRSICGKQLSIGAELWEPAYCQKWQTKYAEQFEGEMNGEFGEVTKGKLWRKKGTTGRLDATETFIPKTEARKATEDERYSFLQLISATGVNPKSVEKFALESGFIIAGQTVQDWHLDKMPMGEAQTMKLLKQIENLEPAKTPEKLPWWKIRVHYGSLKNMTLGELAKKEIRDLEKAFIGKELVARNPELREALDAAKADRFRMPIQPA